MVCDQVKVEEAQKFDNKSIERLEKERKRNEIKKKDNNFFILYQMKSQ